MMFSARRCLKVAMARLVDECRARDIQVTIVKWQVRTSPASARVKSPLRIRCAAAPASAARAERPVGRDTLHAAGIGVVKLH